jgi:hypothetical protein
MMPKKITFMPVSELASDVTPTPSSRSIPDWYKKQSKFVSGNVGKLTNGGYDSTVKKCPAISDTLTAGYTLYTPVDIYLNTTGERIIWQESISSRFLGESSSKDTVLGRVPIVGMHSKEQVSEYEFDRELYMSEIFRIHPQWVVITEPGYSTLFISPMNRDNSPLEAIPGVIDTDTYASNGALSFLVKKGFDGVIKQGTPILQVIPFKREEYEMEILEKPDTKRLEEQSASIRSVFINGYRIKKWVKKIYK